MIKFPGLPLRLHAKLKIKKNVCGCTVSFLSVSLDYARDFWFAVSICNKNLERMDVMSIGYIFLQLFTGFRVDSLLY